MEEMKEMELSGSPKVTIKSQSKSKKFVIQYVHILIVLLIFMIFLFAYLADGAMLRPFVLFGLTQNIVEVGLMALILTYIITTGGIDLSVGSTMSLCGVILGMTYAATKNIFVAILFCLVTGVICGAINGIIIAKTKIPPLVTTLATMSLYYGIAEILCGTNIYSTFPNSFTFLSFNKLFNIIPYQFILFILLFIGFAIYFYRTSVGRYIRAIGYNEKAARFMGVPVDMCKFAIYTISGLICAIASMIYLSRLPAAQPNIGLHLELEAITAVVLGGTSIFGGIGSVTGTFVSMLILGVMNKGLQLIGIGGSIYNFFLGVILIICLIGFYYINDKKKKSRK